MNEADYNPYIRISDHESGQDAVANYLRIMGRRMGCPNHDIRLGINAARDAIANGASGHRAIQVGMAELHADTATQKERAVRALHDALKGLMDCSAPPTDPERRAAWGAAMGRANDALAVAAEIDHDDG